MAKSHCRSVCMLLFKSNKHVIIFFFVFGWRSIFEFLISRLIERQVILHTHPSAITGAPHESWMNYANVFARLRLARFLFDTNIIIRVALALSVPGRKVPDRVRVIFDDVDVICCILASVVSAYFVFFFFVFGIVYNIDGLLNMPKWDQSRGHKLFSSS